MADGADLLGFEAAAHAHHDRGRRLRRFPRKQRPFRQHQMDPRSLDAVDGANGAGEFAFQRAQMIDVLDEARGAERVGFVEDLVADAAALGQVAFGQLHPQPRHLVLRHHDDGAFVAQLEGNRLAFQILDDARGIFGGEVGKQRGHLRRRDAHDDKGKEAEQRGCHRDHGHQPGGAQTSQESNETLHQPPPGIRPQGPTGQLLPRGWFPYG